MTKISRVVVLLISAIIITVGTAQPAFANAVVPAIFTPVVSLVLTPLIALVESFVYYFAFKFPVRRCFLITLLANFASGLGGFIGMIFITGLYDDRGMFCHSTIFCLPFVPPYFLITVIIEYLVMAWCYRNTKRLPLMLAVFGANFLTYAILVGYLQSQIAGGFTPGWWM